MTKSDPNPPAEPTHQTGASQLRALFNAIESRFGRQTASEIWLEAFGEHDATAQT